MKKVILLVDSSRDFHQRFKKKFTDFEIISVFSLEGAEEILGENHMLDVLVVNGRILGIDLETICSFVESVRAYHPGIVSVALWDTSLYPEILLPNGFSAACSKTCYFNTIVNVIMKTFYPEMKSAA